LGDANAFFTKIKGRGMSDLADLELASKRDRLIELLRGMGRVVVAYSGGVDSAVVAKGAFEALGEGAVAVTAVSDSLAEGELEAAIELAKKIGIRHQVIRTDEFANPQYARNNPDRCYFCKSELYDRLSKLVDQHIGELIVSGANADDAGDHRPGLRAAGERGVRHPLQECGLTKADVRALARAWDLPAWDKPASPCLSSRVAYGEEVTPERVRMIDAAERKLRDLGLRVVRVRYHKGDLARIEVPVEELAKLASIEVREGIVSAFRSAGFQYVTLDLEGFRSGSLNAVIPIQSLERSISVTTIKP
jgi:uncharacterized protein